MSTSTQQAIVLVKASHQEEKRKFQLVKDEQQFTFVNLLDKLKTVFSLDKACSVKVSYLDSEKDDIVISSDAELLAALLDQNPSNADLFRLAVAITTEEKHSNASEKKTEKKHHKKHHHHYHDKKKKEQKKKHSSDDSSDKSSDDDDNKVVTTTTTTTDENKKLSKEQRKAEKEAAKIAKKQKREQEKLAKKEQKQDTFDLTDAQLWPSHLRTIHLDGNNMMFMTSTLRHLCLSRKKQACENLLSAVVNAFASFAKVDKTILWFDATTHTSNANNAALVLSAQPMFPSTDHAMIDLSSKMSKEQLTSTVFVTSDNALRETLKKAGAHVLRTKHFLNYVFYHANVENKFEDVNAWMKTLIKE